MKLELSRQIFEKYSNIIFHDNQSRGSRVEMIRGLNLPGTPRATSTYSGTPLLLSLLLDNQSMFLYSLTNCIKHAARRSEDI